VTFAVYIIEIIVSYKIEKKIRNGVKIAIRSRLNSYYKNVCKNHNLL